jgi:hypothetical protein
MPRHGIRTDFGQYGGHVELFDFYEVWRDERQDLIESGINPTTGKPFEGQLLEAFQSGNMALIEASPDAKGDFASFLWQPIQANFYSGYDRVAAQWDKYVGIESVNSFDEVRITGVNGLTGIGYVGELGERPGMRRTIRPEAAIVVDTYGGDYGMTRKLLRSRGAEVLVRDVPMEMGDEMGEFVTRMVVAMIVANPLAPDGTAMYHSSRGNSVVTTLSEDTVVDAAVWVRTQKDPDGRPIRTRLRSAVVQNDGQALRLRQILNSQLVGHTQNDPATTTFTRGTMNPLADPGEESALLPADGIIIDVYFPDANDVYFFGDPNRNPAFVAAFLDGQRRPRIFMKKPDTVHLANSSGNGDDPYTFEERTLQWGVEHDVGVAAVEPLTTYRITPA